MAEVEELCSTLTVINRGRVVFSGTVEELRKRAPAVVHVLHTSDDDRALHVGYRCRGVTVTHACDGSLEVSADVDALDAYVLALGRANIAVRALERRARSLEALFLELTGEAREASVAAVHGVLDARETSAAVS
jgi:ABC-2 type transport system ATP-binding protein